MSPSHEIRQSTQREYTSTRLWGAPLCVGIEVMAFQCFQVCVVLVHRPGVGGGGSGPTNLGSIHITMYDSKVHLVTLQQSSTDSAGSKQSTKHSNSDDYLPCMRSAPISKNMLCCGFRFSTLNELFLLPVACISVSF